MIRLDFSPACACADLSGIDIDFTWKEESVCWVSSPNGARINFNTIAMTDQLLKAISLATSKIANQGADGTPAKVPLHSKGKV